VLPNPVKTLTQLSPIAPTRGIDKGDIVRHSSFAA
jgi:hypothetical protein